jgi:sulfatase maturation enzyme AslB (radical SAM superfamily)
LNFIAQYEHLNSLCILLKPNDERLNVLFRFCVNELLRHLHVGASENLIFIYTNPRSTFFMPGTSKQILQKLLDQHRIKYNVHIPFSRENVFLVDNELFRYLALRKHGIILDNEQTQIYSKSWSINVKEYSRLMERIVACPLHAVSNTLSLNEAEQLIRKLTRPIAETFKLIQENIQLAQRYKENVLENPQIEEQGIPQNNPVVKLLTHPRTVCVGENCCRVIDDGDEKRMEYLFICHDECYLNGVIQETLSDPKLKDCSAMSHINGKS